MTIRMTARDFAESGFIARMLKVNGLAMLTIVSILAVTEVSAIADQVVGTLRIVAHQL